MFTLPLRALSAPTCLCAVLLAPGLANGAERFQTRYNIVGTLPAELPLARADDQARWVASLAYTYSRVHKLTGGDGERLTVPLPGGTFALPAPAPAASYPTFAPAVARVDFGARLRQVNLALAYLTPMHPSAGRWVVGVNLPYLQREQSTQLQAPTPPLTWRPGIPPATQAAVGAAFGTAYQAGLATRGAPETGEVSGFGDADLYAGWIAPHGPVRLAATAAVTVPTGRYDPGVGIDAGHGNFYTFKPSVHAAWQPHDQIILGGKLVAGLNTRNRDTDVRSGNWAGVEAAAGWRLPVGLLGVNGTHIQQLGGDQNNPFGASRLRSTTAGVFLSSGVPVAGTSVLLQHAVSVSSRNARHGSFTQLRLVRVF